MQKVFLHFSTGRSDQHMSHGARRLSSSGALASGLRPGADGYQEVAKSVYGNFRAAINIPTLIIHTRSRLRIIEQ